MTSTQEQMAAAMPPPFLAAGGSGATGIRIENVSHAYGSAGGPEVVALNQINLDIPNTEFHALLGPSGCGKSTLLYLIGGFIPLQRGVISTSKGPVRGPGPDRSIIFQNFALFPWKTVRDNVLYGLKKAGFKREECEARSQEFISLVHLEGFENSYPSQLSGGMQ